MSCDAACCREVAQLLHRVAIARSYPSQQPRRTRGLLVQGQGSFATGTDPTAASTHAAALAENVTSQQNDANYALLAKKSMIPFSLSTTSGTASDRNL